MSSTKLPHDWSAESLLNKAQRYASTMLEKERTDWQFGFWSTLTLEMLARAALANVSPVLVADGKDWNNIYYALDKTPSAKKYVPKSADIAEIFARLEAIFPGFTRELHNFCSSRINLRNTELHSGALPFDGLGTSSWLPSFYSACRVLLKSLGEDLEFLLGGEEAKVAETLIRSLEDQAAKAVEGTIKAHTTVWESKPDKEKELLTKQATAFASRHVAHRVACPSCNTTALLHGSPMGAPTKTIEDDMVVERQSMLPSHFECVACGLKMSGYSKLNSCGLGDAFTATYRYDAAEYFGVPDTSDMYDGMEDDFNEY